MQKVVIAIFALFLSINQITAQEKPVSIIGGISFVGITHFFNYSGISLIENPQQEFNAHALNLKLGVVFNKRTGIDAGIKLNGFTFQHSNNFSENTSLGIVSITPRIIFPLSDKWSLSTGIGGGFATSTSRFYLNNNEYTLEKGRYGFALNVNWSIFYELSQYFKISANIGFVQGKLENVELPVDLQPFKNSKNNYFFGYDFNIALHGNLSILRKKSDNN